MDRLASGNGARNWEYCASYDLDGSAQDGNFFLLDCAGWCQAELFNVVMVSSLLAEEVDFSIQACGVATNINEKLVCSIPQFTYSVIHAQTNTRIHACLECPPSLGLTGMNEARSLPVLFPKGPRSRPPHSFSVARSPALSICRAREDSLATLARPSPSSNRAAYPLPCRFRIEEFFQ